MRRALFLAALGLVLPVVAWAATQTGSWLKGDQANAVTKSLVGGQWAAYTPASGASTSSATPIIDLHQCENFDVELLDDFDGDGTACTVQWTLQMCPPSNSGLNDAAKDLACAALPGVAALSGDAAASKLAGFNIRAVGGGAGANINSCKLIVKCALDAMP